MKISKYCTAIILCLVVAIVIVLFNSNYVLKRYYSDATVQIESEIKFDTDVISNAAEKTGVIVYYVKIVETSINNQVFVYYVANNKCSFLQEHLGVSPGYYNSPVLHNLKVRFADMSELNMKYNSDNFIFYGEPEKINDFISEVSDTEGYKAVKVSNQDKVDIIHYIPYGIFVLAFILIFMFTYLDVTSAKKEIMIRQLHGGSFTIAVLKGICLDSLIFSVLYMCTLSCISRYTIIVNMYKRINIYFIFFVIINSLIYLRYLKINAREIVYGYQHSQSLLSSMQILKFIEVVISFAVMIFAVSMITSTNKYNNAEKFFINNPDAFFIEMRDGEISNQRMNAKQISVYKNKKRLEYEKMFCKTDSVLKPVCMADLSEDSGLSMVYCNHRAGKYISQSIPEINNIDFSKNDLYILLPSDCGPEKKEDVIKKCLDKFEIYEGYAPDKKRVEILTYTNTSRVLCFDGNHDFKYLIDPYVCIASDTYSSDNYNEELTNHWHLDKYSIYMPEKDTDIDEIYSDYSVKVVYSHIVDIFNEQYAFRKSLIYMSVFIFIVMSIFHIAVVEAIVHLDYQVNDTERAVKKIMGYNIFIKNAPIFINSFVSFIFNLAASAILVHILNYNKTIFIIAILLFVIDIMIMCIGIVHEERKNLVKILKGGTL